MVEPASAKLIGIKKEKEQTKNLPKPVFSENALTILKKRYLKTDQEGKPIETPEDLFLRVAQNIAEADRFYGKTQTEVNKTTKEFYELLSSSRFLPNSPCLRGAGRSLQQLSACFVLPIDDNMESIFTTLKHAALVHKTGGGTGFNFSRLRPRGDIIHSTGNKTPGPMSFLRLYNAMAGEVTQGGVRMGANMGMLRADHPDIEDFISSKADSKSLTNFNISISAPDKFMKAVEEDKEYELINPRTKKTVRKVKARKIFEKVYQHAWQNGDPGMIFIDRINQSWSNPVPSLGKIEATNPCVVGDTLVSTEKGLMKIKDVAQDYSNGGLQIATDRRVLDILYDGGEGFGTTAIATAVKTQLGVSLETISAAFKTGVKDVLKLVTESGYELIATPNHKIMTTKGWVEIQDLKPGFHKILIQPARGLFNENGILPFEVSNQYQGNNGITYKLNLPHKWSKKLGQVLGWLIGDGWLRNGDKNCRLGFTFSQDDRKIMNYLKPIINDFYGQEIKEVLRTNGIYHLSYHSKYFVDFFKKLGVKSWTSINKEVPETIFTATEETAIGFLQGLFTADGTVRDNPKSNSSWIALTAKSKKLLQQVQLLLLNLGIKSRIYNRSRNPRKGLFPYITKDGEYKTYTTDGILFELGIFSESRERFKSLIGFLNEKKTMKLENIRFRRFYKQVYEEEIESVKKTGKQEVYDLTEPNTHSMIVNGIVTHQCGEQPLLPYESCVLGSINLVKHVKSYKSGKTTKYKIDWEKLTNTVQKAIHFLDNVIDQNKYAIPEIEEMTKGLRRTGLGIMGFADLLVILNIPYGSKESEQTAKKVMKFINDEARKTSEKLAKIRGPYPFFKQSIDYKKGKKPVRNVARTTIAPTGTISVIADCSSGIEPIFALVHRRRSIWKKDKPEIELLVVDKNFEKVSKERGFYSKELMEKIRQTGSIQEIEEIPKDVRRVFVTSHDLTLVDHIGIQAAFQSHTDNAVSKTINLPNTATVEDVKKAYLLAYKIGCKGITIYRDGSRELQVLSIGKEKQKPAEEPKPLREPRVRPEIVHGTTYKTKTAYGNLYVTVNQDERGNPFEVFAQMGKAGGFFAAKVEAISRLISLALRSGISVENVIDQLKGIRGPSPIWNNGNMILSLPDAIAKVLAKYIKRDQTTLALDYNNIQPKTPVEEPKVDSILQKSTNQSIDTTQISVANLGVVPICPECSSNVEFAEGCIKCHNCGWSQCS